MRKLLMVTMAAVLVGSSFGSLSCCNLFKLSNLGKCFSAQPCELLFALLGATQGA